MQPPQNMYGMAGAMQPQVYGSMPPMMPNQFGMPPMMQGMPMQAGFPPAGAMQGAAPPGGMMGHNPSMPCQAQPPQEPPDSRRRSRSRSPRATRFPPIPSFPDDDGRLSTAYRSVGCVHVHGVKRAFPKKLRISIIAACNNELYPQVLLSQLSEEQIDLLLYCVTGISPLTKPQDFGVRTKGEMRRVVADQHRAATRRNPSRLSQLSSEFDNVATVAMKIGYSPEWLSPEYRQAWELRIQSGSASLESRLPAAPAESPTVPAVVREAPALAAPRRVAAIADGRVEAAAAGEAQQRQPWSPAHKVVAPKTGLEASPVATAAARGGVAWGMPGVALPKFASPRGQLSRRGAQRCREQTTRDDGVRGPSGRRGTEPDAAFWDDADEREPAAAEPNGSAETAAAGDGDLERGPLAPAD